MRVLSLDPGSRKAGFAVIEGNAKNPVYVSSGVLNFTKEEDFWLRIKKIFTETKNLLETYRPHQVVLESLIYVKSPTALIKLAQARGAMISAITQFDLPIYEYSPNLVKSSVTGHGHTDKESIQKWIYLQFGFEKVETNDESDALAIALCHWHHLHSQRVIGDKNVLHRSKRTNRSLRSSLAHKIMEKEI